ncbi:MAG: arsenate reductase (glutaredoxin) [Alphaproteobacteria bacterium]|nr:arsenate reductase (glutaredoxin) [Alphaproteobacteria bacterium]
MTVTIYHNPRCSKSRGALALLREHGIEPVIIEYLKTPPDRETLAGLLALLGCRPHDVMRRKEAAYREHAVARLDDDGQLTAIVENPILLERPIVVAGSRAVIARPPERVLDLLEPST